MELKDFVKATAQSIIDATQELISANIGTGVLINPPASSVASSEDWVRLYDGFLPVTRISFDVAVTEESSKTGDLGGKIKVAVLEAGAGGKVSASDSKVSRIAFELRLSLPSQPAPEEKTRIMDFVRTPVV